MGCAASASTVAGDEKVERFQKIGNNFKTLPELQRALAGAGLEACQLIIGVDFTKSNMWTGTHTFHGRCLHDVIGLPNPYQVALSIIAKTLESFDDDRLIPCYGFGDATTQDRSVFSFFPDNAPAHGLQSLVERYHQLARFINLSGPTSFGPLIRQALRDVYNSGMRYHVLLIIADGQVSGNCYKDTVDAIVQATEFPLSIVMVGVGDGPWHTMRKFDDDLPRRAWDNFQFVELHKILSNPYLETPEMCEAAFALEALMEIPFQYKKIVHLRGSQAQPKVAHYIPSLSPTLLLQPPDAIAPPHVFSGFYG